MADQKPLGAVAHSPPAPETVLLVPVMTVPDKWDPKETNFLSARPGLWRYMTVQDLLCVVRQLSPEDKERVRAATDGYSVEASDLPATPGEGAK